MSIPPSSEWRGCAAYFPQPVEDELAAQCLWETVYYYNCRQGNTPLADVVYRSSDEEGDVRCQVFRWDLTPFREVFQNGFDVRRQQNTPDETYFNLEHYVHHAGRPLDSRRPATHAFVSTTLNSQWNPTVDPGHSMEVYRYEIYAPGGIWVKETLPVYRFPGQDEVTFVAGIAPQYIRSAQLFRLVSTRLPNRRPVTKRQIVNNIIQVNGNFNTQSHSSRLLTCPPKVSKYTDPASRSRMPLTISTYPRPANTTPSDCYAGAVANVVESYVDAAFRSSRSNEVYLFSKNEYMLVTYAPGTTGVRLLNGPLLICDGFPSLAGTAFAEHGVDCAFGCHSGHRAFVFSGNLCALIDYAPGTKNDRIIKGPTTIAAMFPFVKSTAFAAGVDAAFEARAIDQAYLFKGNQYALVNYGSSRPRLIATHAIADGFPSLRNSIFATGIDAAFASHRADEAYLFKGDSYVLINFAPGTNDHIIGGMKKILAKWPSVRPMDHQAGPNSSSLGGGPSPCGRAKGGARTWSEIVRSTPNSSSDVDSSSASSASSAKLSSPNSSNAASDAAIDDADACGETGRRENAAAAWNRGHEAPTYRFWKETRS